MVGVPNHPLLMARFGLNGLRPAARLGAARFDEERARALLAGCAAHSILPLERMLTGAVGHLFLLTAHVAEWPVVRGGSLLIARALAAYLETLGGRIETGVRVASTGDLPPARVYLFDTSPSQLADVAGPVLPAGYVKRLRRYRYGPGAFKMDWALDGPIPWTDPNCLEASTVHLGGTLDEIAAGEAAVWRGEHPERPYVLLVQQSQFDSTRAPEGKHTGYAYCHVPPGSTVDQTDASRTRSSASRRASVSESSPARPPGRRTSSARTRTTSAARSPAASPTSRRPSPARSPASIRTRRRTSASTSARRRPRRAAASTGCAGTTQRAGP